MEMFLKRTLFILVGFLLGILAREYLVGVYSVIFQAVLWTGLVTLAICSIIKRKK